MRIVTFTRNGAIGHGIRTGELIRIHPTAPSAVALAMTPDAFPAGEEAAVADVTLLAPVPRPGKVICIGLNYRAHAIEGGNAVPDYPAVFLRAATSLGGPGDPMLVSEISDRLDFEAELAVVIGRTATAVSHSPLSYVAGYCCFNDGTIRDYQRRTSQWTVGKNFDQTGMFSADLVTPDELPAGAAGLRISSRVNDAVMQDSDTGDLIFDVATLVTTLSAAMTLEPGDVIATGTPAGVGYARTPPLFLKEGDRVDIEIERIGCVSSLVERRPS